MSTISLEKSILEKNVVGEVVNCLRGRGQSPTWGGCWPPTGGGPRHEGKFIKPCVAKIEFGKAGEVEDITTKVKGIASCEFPKEKSLAETTQNLELSFRPPHVKKQVTFK